MNLLAEKSSRRPRAILPPNIPYSLKAMCSSLNTFNIPLSAENMKGDQRSIQRERETSNINIHRWMIVEMIAAFAKPLEESILSRYLCFIAVSPGWTGSLVKGAIPMEGSRERSSNMLLITPFVRRSTPKDLVSWQLTKAAVASVTTSSKQKNRVPIRNWRNRRMGKAILSDWVTWSRHPCWISVAVSITLSRNLSNATGVRWHALNMVYEMWVKCSQVWSESWNE